MTEKGCECVGKIAHEEAWAVADDDAPQTFEQYRLEWLTTDWRPLWTEFAADWLKIYETYRQMHPLNNKPDPDCSVCHGTGVIS